MAQLQERGVRRCELFVPGRDPARFLLDAIHTASHFQIRIGTSRHEIAALALSH